MTASFSGSIFLSTLPTRSVCSGICRRLFTSTTQMLRPCVATTISLAVVGWAISWTATVGRLPLMFVQDCAAVDRQPRCRTPCRSRARSALVMSSRRTRVEPNAGRLPTIGFHVWPKSSVTYR